MKLVLVQPTLSLDPQADNWAVIGRLLEPIAPQLSPLDVVLLPEHIDLRTSRSAYEQDVAALAQRLGCHVIGGSHHEDRASGRVNAGVAVDGSGQIVTAYEKLRPYADERSRVQSGGALGELSVGGRNIMVLICADFWFSDVFARARALPDLVLVPAHSVSRKATPHYSRALWQHLAVARAYEFGVFVGISDWAYATTPGRLSPSGVSGFADPTTADPVALFNPIGDAVRIYDLDFAQLEAFRRDRQVRGFFWKAGATP